jgi:hypothetical protein
MGSPYSCAIALQRDRQVAVPPGSQTGADRVQVCQGEALAISPTSLPPPPLLSVDHVADIWHGRSQSGGHSSIPHHSMTT